MKCCHTRVAFDSHHQEGNALDGHNRKRKGGRDKRPGRKNLKQVDPAPKDSTMYHQQSTMPASLERKDKPNPGPRCTEASQVSYTQLLRSAGNKCIPKHVAVDPQHGGRTCRGVNTAAQEKQAPLGGPPGSRNLKHVDPAPKRQHPASSTVHNVGLLSEQTSPIQVPRCIRIASIYLGYIPKKCRNLAV